MCHIEISAADHRFVFLEFQKICQKICLPLHPVFQPAQLTLGIGCIHGNQIKFIIFQGNDPAFFVMFFYSKSVCYRHRFFFRKYCCSGIASSVGIIPVLVIARKSQIHLSPLALGLLQAENICIQRVETFFKALADAGTNSIYIP